MTYQIKEIFYTLQGEGINSGRPAVFCRFSGCNLWSGKPLDRDNAICKFCDTDFVGTNGSLGGKYNSANKLSKTISEIWPKKNNIKKFVVLTGGEPMLQVDKNLIDALHLYEFEVAVETNGTISCPDIVDWICVSPKYGSKLIQKKGEELKLVFPQNGVYPNKFLNLDFKYFLIQPMDGPLALENTKKAIDFCKNNPKWQLSIQSHKLLGIR
ncbi:MAG: 7-carboxy-7-deazaguanine synthase [Betaproteobacteria bacterium TMED156]|nr:MAG: 7-carboxy-7-deazaguanine synthase [Betaproteobacteria bacterium TMED156]